ncbi:LOW QUALITY PROTEIN: hypothetical protein MXB_875 [Myxobolus squamalis]|nr:LOW QUALITY PROTEIN: hypothetical protein MXB_875 [Myxobolus squamalis]
MQTTVTDYGEFINKEKAKNILEYPNKIYYQLIEHVKDFGLGCFFRIPSSSSVYFQIYYLRRQSNQSIVNIWKQPYSKTVPVTPFLQSYWFGDIDGNSHNL